MEDRDALEEETYDAYDGRDAIIFLIDASVPMFKRPPVDDIDAAQTENDCPFVLAIKCAYNTLCSKIFTDPNDSVAIVLFGTKKTAPNDKYGVYTNTFLLQDLKNPDCEPITQLDDMLNKDGGMDEYMYAESNPQSISLADSLWLCSSIFSKHKSKTDKKQIFLFTNNDEPHSKFSAKQKQAERRIGDLQDGGVSIFLFPIGEEFNTTKVYQELLESNDKGGILPGSMTTDELLLKICRKCQKKRTFASLVFNLDSNTKFGVRLYNLIRPAAQPKRVPLDKRTNEPVKSVTTKFNAETAETLLPSELIKYTTVCDEKIRLDKNDLASLKSKFPSGFTLLGFKPIGKLKLHLHLSPASFIYPDEDLVKGSRMIFGALMHRCKARGFAPLCVLKMTAAMKPRIVALLPHEEHDPNQAPLFGFHVIILPFRNDVRKFNYNELVESTTVLNDERKFVQQIWKADPNQIDAAKAVVKKLTSKVGYTPSDYLDPALRTKWNTLEGMALGRENIESVEDLVMPDIDAIDNRLGQRSTTFNDLVFPLGYQSQYVPSASKAKDPKNEAAVEEAAKNGWVDKMTVDVLKGYLSNQGIKGVAKMKKAECVEKIKLHLNLK
ncbi:X-ray repair cross-complementing protein 6-like isoform X3 [Daphnia pulex]|uniref:X-ray repair cross-complementing protein 6-like isoform X3 n=1 Tax=Daphnia pulex TaxID=6669 RepID=UPI001EDE521F|nr:X-ray repair cross-complementing protein 6-like isoform X3 [Daphnia pulex]